MELTPFTLAAAAEEAQKNVICSVFGDSKTGKTHFAIRCERPLYIAYLDPNTNLAWHLIEAAKEGYGEPIYRHVVPPMGALGRKYADLTDYDARVIVEGVEQFAEDARRMAATRVANGESGGTFVMDGCTMFKGYMEKALLGQSTTLGWRPAKGESGGPGKYDYAKSNAAIRAFVSQFAGSHLDVVLVWEGRPDYTQAGDRIPGKFKTTMPQQTPFAVNTQVETLVALEPLVVNSERVGTIPTPQIRVDWSGQGIHLLDRRMKAEGFAGLKRLLMVDVPMGTEDAKLTGSGEAFVRANTEGTGLEAAVVEEDDDDDK